MQSISKEPLRAAIADLNALIQELEANPKTPTWVIYRVLKSIAGKAEKAQETAILPAEYDELANRN